jgi:hypothetical protein
MNEQTNQWSGIREGAAWVEQVFLRAARIVSGDTYGYDDSGRYVQRYDGRAWFVREYRNANCHPAVIAMMEQYKPHRWQQLLLEWPHKSATDPNRIAYTRDERSGEADRQTVTTIGKYLTRHFPHAPDNLIRDIVAQHTYGGTIRIVNTMDDIIKAVMDGPSSCMTKRFDIMCQDNVARHPYAVYDPSLGWSMAVRYEDGEVMGRCLIWTDPGNENCRGFVRSYKREKGYHSHSGRDEAIDAHLKNLGFEWWNGWRCGTPIMEYSLRRGGWLMPYIDGSVQRVQECGFEIDDDGDIEASNTNGVANAFSHTCEDCGHGVHEDDVRCVGPYDDRVVGECCIDDYTYVYGRRGNQYYVHNDDSVRVDDEYYHTDYLSDNNIVELHDGDYAHSDNAVYIDSQDEYYHVDDDDICYAENTNQYEMRSDCWQCAESCNWYTDDEDSVEVDGETYHPDHAPEVEEETTNETDGETK